MLTRASDALLLCPFNGSKAEVKWTCELREADLMFIWLTATPIGQKDILQVKAKKTQTRIITISAGYIEQNGKGNL